MYVLIILILTTTSSHVEAVPDFNGEQLCAAAAENVRKTGGEFVAATCVRAR